MNQQTRRVIHHPSPIGIRLRDKFLGDHSFRVASLAVDQSQVGGGHYWIDFTFAIG